eukprot:m51a1_g4706 hypothetical protein (541) ;mRNA; r:254125-256817
MTSLSPESETVASPSPALPRPLCLRFGLLWGACLAQWDFEKYVLYGLLASGERGFVDTYARWALASTFVSIASELLNGLVADLVRPALQRLLLVVLSFAELAAMCGMVAATLCSWGGWWAQSLYVARQLCMLQSMSGVWKLLKASMDHRRSAAGGHRAHDSDAENHVTGLVGITGDLSSEAYEFAVLGALTLSGAPFAACVRLLAAAGVALSVANVSLTLHVALCALPATALLGHRRPHRAAAASAPVAPAVPSAPAAHVPSPSPSRQHTPTCECAERYVADAAAEQGGRRGGLGRWAGKRARYVWQTPAVRHSFAHALLNFFLYGAIAYPVTLLATEEGADPAAPSSVLLRDLVQQGATLNAVFLLATGLYSRTLLRCPPSRYYRRALPALCVVTGACTLALTALRLGKAARMVLLSVSQVLPYFLNSYDYYVLCTAVREEYYGAVMSAYALVSHGVGVVFTALMGADLPLGALLAACTALLAASAWHGSLMHKHFAAPDWASASGSTSTPPSSASCAGGKKSPSSSPELSEANEERAV